MKPKPIIKSIWLYLFIIGFGVTSCYSSVKNTIEPAITSTSSITSIKATQENIATINPAQTTKPAQESPPTKIPTQTIKPTSSFAIQLQLTYISTNVDNGKVSIYAMPVGCPENSPPCLGKPELLFEYDSTIYNISWSPDGKRLVFEADGINGKGDIFVADWDGKNIANITNSPNFDARPTWSPDGTRIGYTRCSGGQCQFISVRPDGSDPIRLIIKVDISLLSAVWSPDMTYILFSGSIEEPFNQIYMSDLDGSNLQKITDNNADHYSQIYSPDGSMIAFGQFLEIKQSDNTNIYILNLVNKQVHNLTNGSPPRQGSVQWSIIGNWLTFGGNNNDISTIYIIHPDGMDFIEVLQGNRTNYTPAWRVLP
jgi:WD40-like Beta Propeller Repeat